MDKLTQDLTSNNRREILGWVMYDWANSPFASTVATVFLGPYLAGLVRAEDGISTVAVVATTFAFSEIGVSSQTLVLVMLTLQFVSALGALLFDQVARRIGAKRTIMICLVIWCGAIFYSYFLLYTELQFWILGGIIGLVFGSSPALSRSLFSQMVPHRRESAYFGIYQISERGTSWLGPLIFAAAVQLTGSARVAMLTILAFFIIGLVGLDLTNVRAAIEAAGNELPAVV
jgi:UMF1 family MFS transporter